MIELHNPKSGSVEPHSLTNGSMNNTIIRELKVSKPISQVLRSDNSPAKKRLHSTSLEVYVYDDDAGSTEMVATCLSAAGYTLTYFSDPRSLLFAARARVPSCILLSSGGASEAHIDILLSINAVEYSAPILIISSKGTIAHAVKALRLGAQNYLLRPLAESELIAHVSDAITEAGRRANRQNVIFRPGIRSLTTREREVLKHCVMGATCKETGLLLGLSVRTVEDHRANLLKKFKARNAAHLTQMTLGPQMQLRSVTTGR